MLKIVSPFDKYLKDISANRDENVYIVGGYVRDAILDIESKDIDIAVEGDAIAFGKELAEKLSTKTYKEVDRYSTISLSKHGYGLSLTSTRKEEYIDFLPKVTPTNIDEDLKRRDFTINSIAVNVNSGEILDPFNGMSDLKDKKIRALKRDSFKEDPTRIIRALRYKYKLGFEIECQTKHSMLESLHLLTQVPKSRFNSEIQRTTSLGNHILNDSIYKMIITMRK